MQSQAAAPQHGSPQLTSGLFDEHSLEDRFPVRRSATRAPDNPIPKTNLMKIMIKNLRTGLFLDARDGWTSREKDALLFADSPAAYDYCQSHNCRHGAAILFRFRNPRHDMIFKAS